jgi:hypothetical protein
MSLFTNTIDEKIEESTTDTLFLEGNSCLLDDEYIIENWYFLSEEVKKDPDVAKKIEKLKDAAHPQNLLGKIKEFHDSIYEKTPEQLINNQTNVMSNVKRFLMVAGTFVINPALGLLALWADNVHKKKMTREGKAKLVQKFKDDLEITEEKIKDETDREKKYKLMRYKAGLEKAIDKIVTSPIDDEE